MDFPRVFGWFFGLENGCSSWFGFGVVLEFWFEKKSVVLGLG